MKKILSALLLPISASVAALLITATPGLVLLLLAVGNRNPTAALLIAIALLAIAQSIFLFF